MEFEFEDTYIINRDYTSELEALGVVPGATVVLSTGDQVTIEEVTWCDQGGTDVRDTEGSTIGPAEIYFLLGVEPE